MFISKKEYNRLLNTIQTMQKQNNKKGEQLNTLTGQLQQLLNTNTKLENTILELQNTNEELIRWIEQIINDVGCYKVNTDQPFRIPTLTLDRDSNIRTKQVCIPTICYYKQV